MINHKCILIYVIIKIIMISIESFDFQNDKDFFLISINMKEEKVKESKRNYKGIGSLRNSISYN